MCIPFQVQDPKPEAFHHGVLPSHTYSIQIHTDNARHQIRTIEEGETKLHQFTEKLHKRVNYMNYILNKKYNLYFSIILIFMYIYFILLYIFIIILYFMLWMI